MTPELNPFVGITVTVDVVVEPTSAVAGVAVKLKPGPVGAVPVVVKL